MDYPLLKLLHIGALIFWLGPALGAWLVLKAVDKIADLSNPIAAKVSKVFFFTIVIEHVAFAVLLASGFTLAFQYGFIHTDWLQQKLYIVLLIIVPLEVVDILLGNWLTAQASKKLYAGQPMTKWDQRWIDVYHGPFTKIALLVIPISVLMVMYLAVGKGTIV
ncbi:hypothetical protein GCM10009092_04460 [Bowmanella denitrificans]|uniref:Integral membrane protein n=1 Tax=Bowmanella denitrificans TaxID=366582 RepID=A0ABN0WNU2_9ALTE